MKLAEILAAKQKTIRCPACQTKLDFVQKRILIATGRCRFCATKVIEDLPSTPEAPRVDLETLQRLQARVSRQEIMSMVFLVSFLLIGFFALYVSADDPNAPANWIFFAGLGGLYFFFVSFGWIIGKSIQKRKPKCPFCGKTLNVPLLETTGRCCDCGVGLLNLPEPTGKPVVTLAEYFRNKTKVNSWTISLLTLLVACFYGFPVLFAPVFGAGCGDMMVLLWLLLNAFFIIVIFIPSMVFVLSRRFKMVLLPCQWVTEGGLN